MVPAHPCDKNKNVARVGHPDLFLLQKYLLLNKRQQVCVDLVF